MTIAIGPEVTNGAKQIIEFSVPYTAEVVLSGTADMLFHRWNCEAVEEKAKAAKGSKAKKSDNVESYVYRDDDGNLCLPGEYLRMAVIAAAKFKQDPRSPRKSAMDLFKAAVVAVTQLAPIYRGENILKSWEYEHRCRVVIQRNGITRVRPAVKAGWVATVQLLVSLPEYVSPMLLQEVIESAGRLVGIADFRPSYGRFSVKRFDVVELT